MLAQKKILRIRYINIYSLYADVRMADKIKTNFLEQQLLSQFRYLKLDKFLNLLLHRRTLSRQNV